MAQFRLTIDCDNAAFADDPGGEVARLLREVAREVERNRLLPWDRGNLCDANGNRVGEYGLRLDYE